MKKGAFLPLRFMRLIGGEYLYALVMGLIVLLVFHPAAGNDFVMFDDDINIYNNPMLGELTWARVGWAFADTFYMPRYMPLGWISLMTIFEFGGLNPSSYHTTNVIVHALNAALVFVLIFRGMEMVSKFRGVLAERRWIAGIAACGACFWAVHPLRVEPVSWATGLHYLHASFWAFLSVLLFWARLSYQGIPRRSFLAGAYLCYLFSVLVYPVTLGLPFALWFFEWWLKSGKMGFGLMPRLKDDWEFAPLLLMSALSLAANVVVRHWVPSIFPPSPGLASFGFGDRGLQASYSAVYYVLRPLVPGEVTPVYNTLFANGRFSTLPWVCAASLGFLVAALVLWGRRVKGLVAWCMASAAIGVSYYGLLESPFQTSDRYTYFPSIVLAFGLAIFIFIYVRGTWRFAAGGVVLCWLIWLAYPVPNILPIWRDDKMLFDHIARSLKSSDVAYLYQGRFAIKQASLGNEVGARSTLDGLRRSGASDGVMLQLEEEIAPVYERARVDSKLRSPRGWVAPDALTSQMYALRFARSGDDWTAKVRFERALAIDPGFIEARFNYSLWLAIKGKTDEAWSQYCVLATYPGADMGRDRELVLVRAIKEASGMIGNERILASSSKRMAVLSAGAEYGQN